MRVFLDFEASSLSKDSYPIEVAWVFEDGASESFLIRPPPGWTDWDPEAEAIHHISRASLEHGTAPVVVATRMVEILSGHDLFASAPSWDGKWLSRLLREAGLPRHSLRLRDTEVAQRETAIEILQSIVPPEELEAAVDELLVLTEMRLKGGPIAHRARADAQAEQKHWLAVRRAALEMAARRRAIAAVHGAQG